MPMNTCPNCGHQNRAGILHCEECNASLSGEAAPGTTHAMEEGDTVMVDGEQVVRAGTDFFATGALLRFEFEGMAETVTLQPEREVILGRHDPTVDTMPDVNLAPYASVPMSISRRHAAIRDNDSNHLDVWDLGSSNGTHLNGQRLTAHRPYRLHDGDQLRLGQMVVRVYFQLK